MIMLLLTMVVLMIMLLLTMVVLADNGYYDGERRYLKLIVMRK